MCASPNSSSDASADFARPTYERQMAGLDRLAEVGLRIVDGLEKIVAREVEADEPGPDFDVTAVSRAYERTARSIRMTYVLQNDVVEHLRRVGRIEEGEAVELRRRRAEQAQAQAHRDAKAAQEARKLQAAEALTDILADAHEGGDRETYERHVREARERLRDPSIFNRPTSEIIAAICRGFGLPLDWEALASEAWARDEMQSGKVGAPLKSLVPEAYSSPARGDREAKARSSQRGSPRSGETEGAQPPPNPDPLNAPSVTGLAPRDTSPAGGGGEEPSEEAPPAPPPYIPPPDPDILPGYAVGLPGELPPPRRDGGRSHRLTPRNYTHGFD